MDAIALVAFSHGQDTVGLSLANVSKAGWMQLSAVAIAFYYVWSVELTPRHGTAAVATWSMLFGFLALLPWTA